jgi:predicted hydrocarbon binding protein
MEIKVRSLDVIEPKSVQEVEADLLDKHEQSLNEEPQVDVVVDDVNIQQSTELKEEDVLSYIGKRYNKQINSFDELMAERKENEQLPEEISAYMKYKKETGRGFEDFQKLNKDFDAMNPDVLLREYLASTQDGLDEDDIDSLMDDYKYDEEFDDETTVKRAKIAKKRVLVEAKKYFNSQKEMYKVPLESSSAFIPDDEKENYQSFKQYTQQAKTIEEENNRKRQWFDQKTNEVFGNEFKGFEFNINNKKFTFSPGDASELKKNQSTPQNFIGKFLDEQGLIKDAVGYHKSLSMAMHPDRFAKYFYEQGLADATEDVMRKTKNINMSERRPPEVGKTTDGMQVKAINPDSGRNLKIRSMKRI